MRNPITKKPILAWEITITLIIKFLVIYFLWLWFFSNPMDKNLNASQVQNTLFGMPSSVKSSVESTLQRNTPAQTPIPKELSEATTW